MNISIYLIKHKHFYGLINKKKKILRQNHFYKYFKIFYVVLYLLLYHFKIRKKEKLYSHINSEKWIIMTTNNLENISYYSIFESLNDWKTLILSLNESNDRICNLFNSSDKLVYLSIKDQLRLSYNILKYIPMNSYCRKNIGYLFAIEHGAKEIFEIDDSIMIKNSNYKLYF